MQDRITISDDGFFINIHSGTFNCHLVIAKENSTRYKDEDNRWQTNQLGICIFKYVGKEGPGAFHRLATGFSTMKEALIQAQEMLPFCNNEYSFAPQQDQQELNELKSFINELNGDK